MLLTVMSDTVLQAFVCIKSTVSHIATSNKKRRIDDEVSMKKPSLNAGLSVSFSLLLMMC